MLRPPIQSNSSGKRKSQGSTFVNGISAPKKRLEETPLTLQPCQNTQKAVYEEQSLIRHQTCCCLVLEFTELWPTHFCCLKITSLKHFVFVLAFIFYFHSWIIFSLDLELYEVFLFQHFKDFISWHSDFILFPLRNQLKLLVVLSWRLCFFFLCLL